MTGGPVSDGTMRCPVPSDTGQPCQKTIPAGWTAEMGHGGGHWWQSDESAARMRRGHYSAAAALAGLPVRVHQPEECGHPGASYDCPWVIAENVAVLRGPAPGR